MRPTHRCTDDDYLCPLHHTPLYCHPASGDHACQDPQCRYAHGMPPSDLPPLPRPKSWAITKGIQMADLYQLLGGPAPETDVAEDYARTVDYFGRLSGAMEDGNLSYAWEKLDGLRSAVGALEDRLGKKAVTAEGETLRRFNGAKLDPQMTASAAIALARAHRVGRLLHPVKKIQDETVRQAVLNDEERTRRFHDGFQLAGSLRDQLDVWSRFLSARVREGGSDTFHIAIGHAVGYAEAMLEAGCEDGAREKLMWMINESKKFEDHPDHPAKIPPQLRNQKITPRNP